MMDKYEFIEMSSSGFVEDGQSYRIVYFRGVDPEHQLNVDGHIPKVPMMDYFKAGLEGTLENLIRQFVLDKLAVVPEVPEEVTEIVE